MAASGARRPSDFPPFMSSPEFYIIIGAFSGYLAKQLLNHSQVVYRYKLAQLNSVPTIPISSLKTHEIPEEGELVFIENGIVCPLSSVPAANYHNNNKPVYHGGVEVVVSKTVTSTDQPQGFNDVFHGSSSVHVHRVPFALAAEELLGRDSFVIVKKADTDHHLVLEHLKTVKEPLDPPVKLTKKVVIGENGEHKMSATVEVYKVSKVSGLRTGTRMKSVFGRLSRRNGMAEIEPCPNFPKACFTMRRDEIKTMVREEVEPSFVFGLGLGIVSFGSFVTGFFQGLVSFL